MGSKKKMIQNSEKKGQFIFSITLFYGGIFGYVLLELMENHKKIFDNIVTISIVFTIVLFSIEVMTYLAFLTNNFWTMSNLKYLFSSNPSNNVCLNECSGQCYSNCSVGQQFQCGNTGGQCIPISQAGCPHNYCNNQCYTACPSGSTFSCTSNGGECIQ
jgi:hypothetical protein